MKILEVEDNQFFELLKKGGDIPEVDKLNVNLGKDLNLEEKDNLPLVPPSTPELETFDLEDILDDKFNRTPSNIENEEQEQENEVNQKAKDDEGRENEDEDGEGWQEEILNSNKTLNKVLKSLFQKDGIDSIADEDGKEVSLDDYPLDEEVFSKIVTQYLTQKEEDILQDAIKVKELSSITKELIEFEKNGGNPADFLNYKSNIERPLEQLDTDNPSDQRRIVYAYYKDLDETNTDEDIKMFIDSLDKSGKLRDASDSMRNKLKSKYKSQFEANYKKMQSDLQEFSLGVETSLQEDFGLKGKVKKEILKLATNIDKDSNTLAIDQEYLKARKDPKRAAELAYMLADFEGYRQFLTAKAVEETQKKSFKLINSSKKAATTGGSGSELSEDEKSERVFKFMSKLQNN